MVGTRSRAIRVGTSVELIVGEGRARLRVVSKASRFTRGKPDSARPTSRPSCLTMLAARRGRAVA
jgi:hypothetical protein